MKDNKVEKYFVGAPEMPESLSKEAIIEKIEKNNIKPRAPKQKKNYFVEIAAAVFAVIIVATVVFGRDFILERSQGVTEGQEHNVTAQDNNGKTGMDKPEPIEDESLPEGVYTFENEKQLSEYLEYMANNIYYNVQYSGAIGGDMIADADGTAVKNESIAEGVNNAASPEAGGAQRGESDSFTGTNAQNSVDEGDIIKTDGRYIYVISQNNGVYYLKITDTETMKLLSSVRYGDEDTASQVHEMYVNGDKLVVLYNEIEKNGEGYFYYGYSKHSTETRADIYDISDRSNPKKLRTVTQDGSFNTSRMIGTVLYTVTLYSDKIPEDEGYYVPEVNGEKALCSSVIHFGETENAYTVITATDISDTKSKTESLNILSRTTDIYCSENNMYLLTRAYEEALNKTCIRKITLDGTKISCVATGEIAGHYDDKYSFDEYEGKLRAVTTNYDYKSFKNKCALYILDEKLNVTGQIEDITEGLNEEVKSVRFVGEKAYVVTFEQTDPLFIIDLSDEKAPKVTGELFMPGYSTYLHPLSDSLLLGIGYGGDEENADMNKLKIALFDVSDMTKPALVDEFVINNSHSDANYEPKALIHYASKNIIGIPVTVYNYGETFSTVKSYAIINYTDNKLSSVEGFVHSSYSEKYSNLFRGICIEESLYTVDDYRIVEHSLASGEKQRECELFTEKELKEEAETMKGTVAVTSSGYNPAA